jgi:TonB family C-terminal domain
MSAVPKTRLLHTVPEAPKPAAGVPTPVPATGPGTSGEAVLVDVVVLTADLQLFQSIREAVGERNPVWRARSAEEAADLLITGRCGVLLIDLACVSTRADTLIEQIVEQFPDVVVCVAGTRQDEPILASLISDGLVYRFMHKPASARRAGMFLHAAIRRHVERRGDGPQEATLPLLRALARPSAGLPKRYLALLAAVGLVLTLPLFVGHDADVAPTETPLVAPASSGSLSGDAGNATGAATRSDPVLSRARAALQAGRLEAPQGRNALDLYAAVLLAQPDHVEAREGRERTIALLLERAGQEARTGRKGEAERLVQRVLAVDPENDTALEITRRLNPPDTPSQQLAREQLGVTDATPPVSAPPPAVAVAGSLPGNDARRLSRTPVSTLPEAVTKLPVTAPVVAAVVQPDPLAPRYVTDPTRIDTLKRPRVYGGTVANAAPIAGLARSSAAATPVPTASEPAPTELMRVPADALERISARDPVYPAEALRQRVRGEVELEFTIAPGGNVRDIEVVHAEPQGVFDAAATDALAQWRFRPRFVNGQAVAQRSTVTMRFDVDE